MAGERTNDLTNTGRILYRVAADDVTVTNPTRVVRRVLAQRIAPDGTEIAFHWQAAPVFSSSDERSSMTYSTRELTRAAEQAVGHDEHEHEHHEDENEDMLDAVRDTRVAVLARKQENPESAEHAARFRLLTEKLRALDPRVTEHEHAALAKSTALLEHSVDLIAKIKRAFGV